MSAPTPALILLAWLWQTTWQSALLAVVVLLASRLLRRWITPQARQLLWLLVFLRLVMPALPGSRLSAFSWVPSKQSAPSAALPVPTPPLPLMFPAREDVSIRIAPTAPATHVEARRINWENAFLFLWFAGSAAIFGAVIVRNLRFGSRLKAESSGVDPSIHELVTRCCDQLGIVRPPAIYLTRLVATPSLYAVIHPRLLLPANVTSEFNANELRLIILHELEHLRRHHLKVDWLLTAISCLHWFNPIPWRVHRQIRIARELICDRAVLNSVDDDGSRRYGLTMLAMANSIGRRNRGIPLAAFAEAQNDLQQRIEAIASRRRKYIFGLGAIAVITIAAVFLTRPVPEPKPLTKAIPTTGPSKEAIDELIRVSRGLTEEHDYAHALQIIDRILELDPRNDYAIGTRTLVEDRALIAKQNAYRDAYDAALRYPRNWPNPKPQQDAKTNAEVLAKLERKLPEIKFDAVGFSDVIDYLRDVSSANIFVNWRAIQEAGIDRSTPVTARLRDVKLSKALEIILRDIGGEKTKLSYSVDEGVITISTADDLAASVVTNVFDIRDLIAPLDAKDVKTQAELIARIVKLIQGTVASDSWKDNGGKSGSTRELSGQLIITQTPDNQRAIATLLQQLRETRAIQITIESSLIELSDAKAAEILAQDEARSATKPALFLRRPATNTTRPTLTPITDFGGNNATRGGLLMDDTEMPSLLAKNRQAANPPRITLYNGQEFAFDVTQPDTTIHLKFQATISSDRRSSTITASANGKYHQNDVKLDPVTFSMPDGASCLMRIPSETQPTWGNLWLVVKPTLIYQRDAEQEQFPSTNSH